ncbi:MAG TPA: hypothetical protein VKV69_11720 [Actinomycetota bacterium]|nr:hypothetical protein [Actinomycetota bacterium]
MDQVRLPDLEVIRRYSIAVRREHASADEVLEALQSDIDAIKRALRGSAPSRSTAPRSTATAAPRPAARRRPAPKSRTRRTRRG